MVLENVANPQLVKILPTFYRTRRFSTVFTTAHLLFISWVKWTQSTHPHPITLPFTLILSSYQLFVAWPTNFNIRPQPSICTTLQLRTKQDQQKENEPGVHPASCTMGTGSLPGVKRPGRGVNRPPPSRAEVKETVELYLYSPSVPSWQVMGWTLPLPLTAPQFAPVTKHSISERTPWIRTGIIVHWRMQGAVVHTDLSSNVTSRFSVAHNQDHQQLLVTLGNEPVNELRNSGVHPQTHHIRLLSPWRNSP